MRELEQRVSVLERELALAQAQLQRHEHARRAVSGRWFIASLGVFLALSLSLPGQVPTQPPAAPRAVTRFDVPVVFMDGARQVAEIRSGGLTLNGLKGNRSWSMGVTAADEPLLQGLTNGKVMMNIDSLGLNAYNAAGVPVAAIGATKSGSGYMTLGNPQGAGIVESGMMPDGRGVVRVYPLGGPPPTVIPKVLMGGTPKG